VREGGERCHHLPDGLAHLRVRAKPAGPPGLDQHVLLRRDDHPEPLQGLLGLTGLAGVVGGHVLGGQAVPGHEHRGDQHEPAEDGGLAVPGTPAGDALDDRGPVAGRAARVVAGGPGFRQY
jgi:hypothetical protein